MIIGLDAGGTHIDGVIIEDGKIIDIIKRPTDRSNPTYCILKTLEELLKNKDLRSIQKINLSTTISTNAIIEGKNSPVAMFIESGPGIDPSNFTCGNYTVFLDGYIDHRGREIKPFSKKIICDKINQIRKKGINSAAVVTKFSTRNPSHELEIKNILVNNNFSPITMGHTLSGKLSFPRRIYTAYLNSTIYDCFNNFSQGVKKALEKKKLSVPVYILKADGGTMTLDEASNYPVQTILSGPSASVMGCLSFFTPDKDTLLLDIGGTTTDISFLADGVPLLVPHGISISEYPTLIRSIYNISIGLGGDSEVRVNENGEIKIGPTRQGSSMALGGPVPTPSDAMIVLGKMNFGNKDKACEAMKLIGNMLNKPPHETAEVICDKFVEVIRTKVIDVLNEINNHPVYTIHELLYGKKINPKNIIAIGGPAKAFASKLEEKFNIPCNVPENYQIANAIGAALARETFEITLLADTQYRKLSVPELGIHKEINTNYNLKMAKKDAAQLLSKKIQGFSSTYSTNEIEFIEENSFNMVRGFFTSGRNIRVRAQIKPGLIYRIGGNDNA